MTVEQMLREFHSVFGSGKPGPANDKLRIRLIREEFRELRDAIKANDEVEIADALADLVYVAVGTAVVRDIPFDKVFAEVHRSNMTKRGPNGEIKIREDGKIIKGPWFDPPHIAEILEAS